MSKIRKAVIPVAGLGTRMLPAAKSIPKEMITLVDRPLIHYIVEEAITAGIETIILVTGRGKSSLEDYFDHTVELELNLELGKKIDLLRETKGISTLTRIISVRQKNPLGLGHAVLCAEPMIEPGEQFAVLLGDDLIYSPTQPCIGQLMKCAEEQKSSGVIGVMKIPSEDTTKYGLVKGKSISSKVMLMEGMVEKPKPENAPSLLATPGRYILPHSIFSILKSTPPGAGGEIQLTDGINKLCGQEKVVSFEFEGERHDCGNKMGLLQAQIAYALKREEFQKPLVDFMKKTLQEMNF